MTRLTKPVRRECGTLGLRGGDAGEYVVTLYPGGVLGLRRKRRRKELQVTLADCYRKAAAIEAEQLRKQRRAKRRRRKENR